MLGLLGRTQQRQWSAESRTQRPSDREEHSMIRQTRQNGLSHPRLNQTVFAGDLTMQNRDETLIWAWSLSSPIFSRASLSRGIHIRREVGNEKLTKFEKN